MTLTPGTPEYMAVWTALQQFVDNNECCEEEFSDYMTAKEVLERMGVEFVNAMEPK